MKKVLVTGAAGFIGGYCAREFAARGWHVFALEHRTPMAKFEPGPGALTVLRGDASDGASLGDAARAAGGFDAAAHCAGRASDVGRREEFRRANLEPVRHLAGQSPSSHPASNRPAKNFVALRLTARSW